MAATVEKIYETAIRRYHMKLLAGKNGLYRLVDWIHVIEETDYTDFLKGRELVITTGIKSPDESELLEFVQKIYSAGASGLAVNIGKYIPKVPQSILQFGEEHDFPVFTIPWEVHLVDFNRELCNLIYRMEQEYTSLDDSVQKVIFTPKDLEQQRPVFQREGITGETPVRLIQCYVPFSERKKTKEKNCDATQFFYHFHRYCEQSLSRFGKRYVVFRHDLYLTMVLFDTEPSEIKEFLEEIRRFGNRLEGNLQIYTAVSGCDTKIVNLSEKYKNMSLLCRKNEEKNHPVCMEDEIGVWKILLDVPDRKRLKAYENQMLGELEQMDAETGSEYCRILESYLENNGNIQEVASQCFLHRNTVAYHLKKISEITGRNLSVAQDRHELYLAFQIQKLLEV